MATNKNILILIGPNLNMLGRRDPKLYGSETLDDIMAMCGKKANDLGYDITFKQSNHEGEIVTWIQDAVISGSHDALMINAGAYTHTSIAIHDALELLDIPIIEVHNSDPHKREKFRHNSYIERLAAEVVKGHGAQSYIIALENLKNHF